MIMPGPEVILSLAVVVVLASYLYTKHRQRPHSASERYDPRTTPPLVPGGMVPDIFFAPGNPDVAWLQDHATRPKK